MSAFVVIGYNEPSLSHEDEAKRPAALSAAKARINAPPRSGLPNADNGPRGVAPQSHAISL
jgi:hypothetical protein